MSDEPQAGELQAPIEDPLADDPAPQGAGQQPTATVLDGEAAKTASEQVIKAKDQGNWRDQFAGADDKTAERLARYQTPEAFAKAHMELQQKLSSGEAKLAEKPEDDVGATAWREERGIPEKAEGYAEGLNLPEGLVLGEADEPIMSAVYEAAHKLDLPASQLSGLAGAMLEARKVEEQRIFDRNNEVRDESLSKLAGEHGGELKAVTTRAEATMRNMFGDAADLIAQARLPDGTSLFAHDWALNAFDQIGRQLNPTAAIIPSGMSHSESNQSRIAAIEATIGTPEYDNSPANQKELLDLIEAEERLAGRG